MANLHGAPARIAAEFRVYHLDKPSGYIDGAGIR